MSKEEYAIEVTSLSPKATEKDLRDFFAFCGPIELVEIVRAGEYACTAYVTFKEAYSLQTALLLSGATILDQHVCITSWGHPEHEFNPWDQKNWNHYNDENGSAQPFSAGEAVTMAQDVVKAMVSKGYSLGKGTLNKAKAFDESHQVSATAAARVGELSDRIGLTDKLFAGVEAVRSVDQTLHITDSARAAASATGRTAAAAATNVINSSYFSKGALWMSNALGQASKIASDLGTKKN